MAVASGLALLTPAPATAAAHPPKPRRQVYAYITSLDGHVYVIDTRTNNVLGIATTTVGGGPEQVAVTPDGASLYVTNAFKYVSVVNIAKRSVTNIPYDQTPLSPDILYGEAIAPDGKHAYVAVQNPFHGDKVSVINTTTGTVTKTIPIGDTPPTTGPGRYFLPAEVAVTPDGKSAYVVGSYGNGTPQGTVFAINTATEAVTPITVGAGDTMGVAIGRL
ncbi:YncE family protein [Kitasatospora sp. NBC_01266]|uniref:YncE family protein n=1 Tax=Kitasatospora sp. NBC_01266 TaxID=2903572 RepID=UPI002E354A91|nr:YncE family protein [Kitasatospora sp. NBC_01266]